MRDNLNNGEIDYNSLDALMITVDLQTLGELAADIVGAWCKHRGQDIPLLYDAEGQITEEARVIASSAWQSVLRMNDRREFAESVSNDLEKLLEA